MRLGFVAFLIIHAPMGCISSRRRAEQQRAVTPARPLREIAINSSQDAGPPTGQDLPVPTAPEPWMKAPPCDSNLEEYPINGACWQATPRRPPCGQLRRWKDGCYRPLRKPETPPISGQ